MRRMLGFNPCFSSWATWYFVASGISMGIAIHARYALDFFHIETWESFSCFVKLIFDRIGL